MKTSNMKTKRFKIGALAAILLIGASSLQSCKKGENDPVMSFQSRDARITGVWKLTKLEGTSSSSYTWGTTTNSTVSSTNYADGLETSVYNGTSSTSFYTLEYTIEKGGEFKYNWVDTEDGSTEEFTSNWLWLNHNKKKSGISIDGSEYDVDRLTNKELILKRSSYSKDIDSDGDWSEYSSDWTYTFEKKK